MTRRISTVAAAATMTCLAITSCSSPDTVDQDVSAVGENGAVGDIDLLSILLVASAEDEPGRLLGTLENESDESVDVTISDDDDEIIVAVPAGEEYRLEDNEHIFDSVGDAPGANTTITASTATESTELLVPVHDGALERFQPYLPD
ncbi:hypothetical protein [Arthrobacter sp. TMS2-4]